MHPIFDDSLNYNIENTNLVEAINTANQVMSMLEKQNAPPELLALIYVNLSTYAVWSGDYDNSIVSIEHGL